MSTHPSDPRVSCVVAVYNGAAYLRESIDSLLAQDYPHVEVVVVDDGSTDATAGIIDGYGHRIRAVRQANAGVSAARNRGVAESSGDLLCFLDGDDLLLPEKIRLQVEAFVADERLELCDCESSFFWSPEMSAEACRCDPRYAQPFWRETLPGHIGTWLFRRDVWERVGGFSPAMRYAEDVDWFSRACDLPVRRATLPRVLTRRRLHPQSVTAARGPEQAGDLVDAVRAHLMRARGNKGRIAL